MSSRPNTETHQLEFSLAVDDAADGGAERTCPICSAPLADRRRDALYCGGPCRAEASRLRRLREGLVVDGYPDLAAYKARQTRTEGNGSS